MTPTPIKPTLVNVTLNPYAGKRPKKPIKKYDIKTLFTTLSNKSYPHVITPLDTAFIAKIRIDSVSACLPGSRGCITRERHGTQLENRQVARLNDRGVTKNPKFNYNNITKFGFLKLVGMVIYKDGTESKINIPIDASGVIGLRTGVSAMVMIKPTNIDAGKSITIMINEIETLLFKFLNFEKTSPARIEMINGAFNMYTNKTAYERPKLSNFSTFLNEMHRGIQTQYGQPSKPWLNHQGGALVIKSVFKSKENLPTITISPYGRVEIMGAKSFEDMVTVYKIVMDAFSKIQGTAIEMKIFNHAAPKKRKEKQVDKNFVINGVQVNAGVLMINRKKCQTFTKPMLAEICQRYGMVTKGTKESLCSRLKTIIESKANIPIPAFRGGKINNPLFNNPNNNTNNSKIPSHIIKDCHTKGISIHDRQTLKLKPLALLKRQCYAKDGRVARTINHNALKLKIEPFADRAYKIYKEHKPKISKTQAKLLAKVTVANNNPLFKQINKAMNMAGPSGITHWGNNNPLFEISPNDKKGKGPMR